MIPAREGIHSDFHLVAGDVFLEPACRARGASDHKLYNSARKKSHHQAYTTRSQDISIAGAYSPFEYQMRENMEAAWPEKKNDLTSVRG